jgi:hypothetical protein
MKVQKKPTRRKAMESAQYSAFMAQEFYNAFQSTRFQLFWANFEIAALMTYWVNCLKEANPTMDSAFVKRCHDDLEKAMDCWPANVEI